MRIGALGKGDHRRGLSPSRSGREVGCRLAFCLVVEDIQFDVSRFRERCVKSFLRHHLSRGTACKPFTLVDPYLDPLRAEVALSVKGGKATPKFRGIIVCPIASAVGEEALSSQLPASIAPSPH